MIQTITAKEARDLIARGELDVVDVRDAREWSTGHLPGARLVPLARLKASPSAVLPKDGVIFVCAAGIRSETAAKAAEAIGLRNLYNLGGGTRGGVNAGFPVVKD